MQQASKILTMQEDKIRFLHVQQAIKLCKQKKVGKKLQYYKAIVEIGQWWLPIPVKLLSPLRQWCS
jgi:hypothetical protein